MKTKKPFLTCYLIPWLVIAALAGGYAYAGIKVIDARLENRAALIEEATMYRQIDNDDLCVINILASKRASMGPDEELVSHEGIPMVIRKRWWKRLPAQVYRKAGEQMRRLSCL